MALREYGQICNKHPYPSAQERQPPHPGRSQAAEHDMDEGEKTRPGETPAEAAGEREPLKLPLLGEQL